MKRTNKYLDNLVTKIINETLEEKADQVMAKLKPAGSSFDYVAEGETCECGSKEFYEGMCVECGNMKGEVMEKECTECGPGYMEEDMNQLELDEFEDEDWLRATDEIAKELERSKRMSDKSSERRGHSRPIRHKEHLKDKFDLDSDEAEMEEGNAFTDALRKTPKGGKFKLGNREYTDRSSLEERWKGKVEVEKTGEHSDETVKELDKEIKSLKTKTAKAKESGKKVSKADREKMGELYFAKRAKQGWPGKGKSKVEETLYRLSDDKGFELFTEDEIIDLIENIIIEEKEKSNIKKGPEHKGLTTYRNVHIDSGKEGKEYLESVAKKMTDYIKDGSKGKYETNPKHFPKGNGQLAKMDKKAYEIDEDGIDFNMEVGGQMIPDYDGKPPKKEYIEKQIKGSSDNGNNQEWANAENTGVNDKFAEYFENDQLAKWKDESYGRVPSPVYDENPKTKKTKKDKPIKEEFERISELMQYSRKTQ